MSGKTQISLFSAPLMEFFRNKENLFQNGPMARKELNHIDQVKDMVRLFNAQNGKYEISVDSVTTEAIQKLFKLNAFNAPQTDYPEEVLALSEVHSLELFARFMEKQKKEDWLSNNDSGNKNINIKSPEFLAVLNKLIEDKKNHQNSMGYLSRLWNGIAGTQYPTLTKDEIDIAMAKFNENNPNGLHVSGNVNEIMDFNPLEENSIMQIAGVLDDQDLGKLMAFSKNAKEHFETWQAVPVLNTSVSTDPNQQQSVVQNNTERNLDTLEQANNNESSNAPNFDAQAYQDELNRLFVEYKVNKAQEVQEPAFKPTAYSELFDQWAKERELAAQNQAEPINTGCGDKESTEDLLAKVPVETEHTKTQ